MMRHRPHVVDVIVSRALVYTALTAVIGAVYFGVTAAAAGLGSWAGLFAAQAAGRREGGGTEVTARLPL